MGLFDFLFKKRPQITDPAALREALWAAAAAQDASALGALCRGHRELIRQHFKAWTKPGVPPSDRAAMNQYVAGLLATAQYFEKRLGEPELMAILVGPPGENPILQWEEALGRAKKMIDEVCYADAKAMLNDLLIDRRGLQGSGAERLQAMTHGMLAVACLNTSQAAQAAEHGQVALRLCEQNGDTEGVATYLATLYDVHRYLGEWPLAAERLARLAEITEQQGRAAEAARRRRQAKIVLAGEPLLRAVIQIDGVELELDELASGARKLVFVFARNRPTLRVSTQLVEQGDAHVLAMRFDDALTQYAQATHADPYDPQPHYHSASSHAMSQRYPQAIEELETTSALAPGWYDVNGDRWLLQELLAGRLPHEAFTAHWALDAMSGQPKEKEALARRVLAQFPDVPHLHFAHGLALASLKQRDQAAKAYRAALALDPEPDLRSRVCLQLAANTDPGIQRDELLRAAQAPGGNLMAGVMAEVTARMASQRTGA